MFFQILPKTVTIMSQTFLAASWLASPRSLDFGGFFVLQIFCCENNILPVNSRRTVIIGLSDIFLFPRILLARLEAIEL
jgi:hypothetical protein